MAIAKSIANQTREVLDCNRQCLAEGLANLVGGLFQCMPGSGSLTRSAINYQAGAVSRWSGVYSAAAVALVVLLLAPLALHSQGGLGRHPAGDRGRPHRPQAAVLRAAASRYDASLVLVTAGVAVFVGVEWSILIGTALSILLYVPRAARLHATELAMSPDRVVRDRLPTDAPCNRMLLFDLEGELFFGAAPELDRCLEDLKKKLKTGIRMVVLRLKRTRNPDVVCMECLQHFLQEMQEQGVTVLLCGVRPDFAEGMTNLRFHDWLPRGRVFLEDAAGRFFDLGRGAAALTICSGPTCATLAHAATRDRTTARCIT